MRSLFDLLFGRFRANVSLNMPTLQSRRGRLKRLRKSAKHLKGEVKEYERAVRKLKEEEAQGNEEAAAQALKIAIKEFYDQIKLLSYEIETIEKVEFDLKESIGDLSKQIGNLSKKHPGIKPQLAVAEKAIEEINKTVEENFEKAQKQARDVMIDNSRMREFSLLTSTMLMRQLKRAGRAVKKDYPKMKGLKNEIDKLDHSKLNDPKQAEEAVNAFIKHMQDNKKDIEEELKDLYKMEHTAFILETRFKETGLKELEADMKRFTGEGMRPELVQDVKNYFEQIKHELSEEERRIFYRSQAVSKAAA